MQMHGGRGVAVAATLVAAAAWAAAAQGRSAARVTVGATPAAQFPQNKQNEPAVAVDPAHPQLMAAGANDWIDAAPCRAADVSDCMPPAEVGESGIYFSTDGGTSWVQPRYTGLTTRDCTGAAPCEPHSGPIGTLQMAVSGGGSVWAGGSYDPETHVVYVYSRTGMTSMGLVPPAPGQSDMGGIQTPPAAQARNLP